MAKTVYIQNTEHGSNDSGRAGLEWMGATIGASGNTMVSYTRASGGVVIGVPDLGEGDDSDGLTRHPFKNHDPVLRGENLSRNR